MTLTELFEAEMINRLGFKHTMRNGKQIAIKDMSDEHLINAYMYFSIHQANTEALRREKDQFDEAVEYFITRRDSCGLGVITFAEDPEWELNTKDRICQNED